MGGSTITHSFLEYRFGCENAEELSLVNVQLDMINLSLNDNFANMKKALV